MKTFISFVRKEFLHILRDKTTLLIMFAMPIVMIILFSYAISTEVKNISVAVLDFSKDEQTNRIIEKFNQNKYFQIKQYLTTNKEIEVAFKEKKINLVMVFSENFAENMLHTHEASIQLLADGSEANSGAMYIGYAQGVLGSYLKEINSDAGATQSFQIQTNSTMLYNPQSKSEYNFVPGVIGMMLLLLNAMMSSIAIVREKERGTMELLLASPMPPIQIILSKTIPYLTLSSITLLLVLVFAHFVVGVPINGSVGLLLLLCLLYIFTALSMGLLISTVMQTQISAMLVSGMVLMLPTIMLSGMVFPIESMPNILQWLSCIVPARWFISALRKIMIQGVDITAVSTEFLILIGMVVLYLIIALKKFKIRLQ